MRGLDRNFGASEILSERELAQEIEKVLTRIKKVRWDNEKIQNELGRRDIKTIQSSGETFYMGACVDMTLSFLMQMREKIGSQNLEIGCEFLRISESNKPAFHLFLKDKSTTPQRIIDFVRNNEVSVYPGEYHNPKQGQGIESLYIYSLGGEKIDENDSFLSLAKKMKIQLPPELFQAYLSKLQYDNTPENFQNFQRNSPIDIKIHTYSKSQQAQTDLLTVLKKRKAD